MKPRILIVDNEEIILLGWKYTLSTAGYDVDTAISGTKALEIVSAKKPDIVITDLIMPEMNGIELCTHIKKISPDTEVILVSGHPEDIKRYKADFVNAGGMEDVLKKPLSREEIVEAVQRIIRRKTADKTESI